MGWATDHDPGAHVPVFAPPRDERGVPLVETRQILVIGSGEAKEPLRAVIQALRGTQVLVSCYFDGDLSYAEEEVRRAGCLLLGLSRASRQPTSKEHELEEAVLRAVNEMENPIPCAVLRDVDGYISAPYLIKHGELFRLVLTANDNGKKAPLMLFKNFSQMPVRNPAEEADDIAFAILQCLQPKHAPASE